MFPYMQMTLYLSNVAQSLFMTNKTTAFFLCLCVSFHLPTVSLQNVVPLLDGPVEGGAQASSQQQLQEQEKRIEISCALAAEASRRSRLLSAQCVPPTSPTNLAPPPSSADFPNSAHTMKV